MSRFKRHSKTLTLCMTVLLSALVAACSSADGGRDPVFGTGNLAVLAPTVTAVTPLANATDVPLTTTTVTAAFSRPVLALSGDARFTLTCAAPCTSPAGTVALNANSTLATFTLATGTTLAPLTLYTATVTGAASRDSGVRMSTPYVWRFTTEMTPDTLRPRITLTNPATTIPGPTLNVPTDRALTAVFSEDMDADTLTTTSFTLTCAAPCVAPTGVVSYDAGSRSAVFQPAAPLAVTTTYTATVTAAATDLAGNGLAGNQGVLPGASDYVWTFTTGVLPDTTRPRVTLTTPLTTNPGPTAGAATNTAVSALFSEELLPGTVTASSFTLTCASPCVSPAGNVSYVPGSRTAIFAPATALLPSTTYTATLTTAITDLAGSSLAGNQAVLPAASNYVWTFTTGLVADTTPPRVTLTVPLTTDPGPTTDVPPNTAITAIFSEELTPTTISATTFTLTCAAPCVNPEGTVRYLPGTRSASFTPTDPLDVDTTYTVTFTTAVSDLAGNALSGNQDDFPAVSEYIWTFTTGDAADTTAPIVTLTVPVTTDPGPTIGASINAPISAIFSEEMAPETFGATSFTVTCEAPCVSPEGDVTYIAGVRDAIFSPLAPLEPSTTYTATITTEVTDLAGNPLSGNQGVAPAPSNYVWTFTTGLAPDTTGPSVTMTVPLTTSPGPTPGASTNTEVIAIFSEEMDPASLTEATFFLTCEAPCAAPTGDVSYVAGTQVAIFMPLPELEPGTTYTARITTGATDLASNALRGNQAVAPIPSDYVWTFTTTASPDTTAPTVILTAPLTTFPGPTPDVSTNTTVTAAFSENMAPMTISFTSFTLTCESPCTSPAGTVSYVSLSQTAAFAPTVPLAANTTYTATVTTAVTDQAGNALSGNQDTFPAPSAYIWTFTTGATPDTVLPTVLSTNPLSGAIGICTNKTINATFSELMDGTTISGTTFTLETALGAAVPGTVSYNPTTNIASFDPLTSLVGTPASTYTATIVGGVGGVADLGGNELAADRVFTFTTNASTCTTAPPLGAAAPFGGFGGSATLTNDGTETLINGDIGVSAASTQITGLRDSGGNVYTVTGDNDGMVNGLVYTLTDPPDSVAGETVTAARASALVAFNSISPVSLPGGVDVSDVAACPSCGGLVAGDADQLAGRTLPPGIYKSAPGTYDIGGAGSPVGNLTLDAGGDADAVWIFQTAAGSGTLTVGLTGPAPPATPIQVLLLNGAQAKNVFWYIPGGAEIGTGSTMVGTLLADASITMSTTGGSPPTAPLTFLQGRALALTAGVTMTNTVIDVPSP